MDSGMIYMQALKEASEKKKHHKKSPDPIQDWKPDVKSILELAGQYIDSLQQQAPVPKRRSS